MTTFEWLAVGAAALCLGLSVEIYRRQRGTKKRIAPKIIGNFGPTPQSTRNVVDWVYRAWSKQLPPDTVEEAIQNTRIEFVRPGDARLAGNEHNYTSFQRHVVLHHNDARKTKLAWALHMSICHQTFSPRSLQELKQHVDTVCHDYPPDYYTAR